MPSSNAAAPACWQLPCGRGRLKPATDEVINVYEKLTLPEQLPYERNWFRTDGGYVNAATVQPLQRQYNRPFHQMPPTGLLGEITLPFADARRYPEDDAPVAYRLYYATTYWIKERVTGDSDGACTQTPIHDPGITA